MHQCQLTGSQSDWVKLRVLAETPMDSRSMKRKQHSMSDPVRDGQLRLRSGRSSELAPAPERSGVERMTKMIGAGAESERSFFSRSDNSSTFSFACSVNERKHEGVQKGIKDK
jgi:hypothetical protein